ncbi:MAG: 16S rRNA (cytosine(1402)-N(4))-methyltransferase [Candidatus Magasanikbacteria bacterium CG10_big_fil_rev_8_21_14_0_10_47_10]|uniref:Ribosomal RNA small subunit methyltransferase H n=1 Tax=Candidatus Magasanikbacteria bacterium CG10_big_fil_rev_8_21_14_0_10_47_10 TaxID=1974652 RepID=A0A2H0TP71_9BACT|nr:MAG: 16S rRNA (cytosine(1402)-N(4))-methyltransferase [Candidatus Magasanikbacteria bacterium CG10_big_fil_rev_8_21_14_0_10_47_10]
MRHTPVLLSEVLEYLRPTPGMHVIDCTLGDAGHSEALLQKIVPHGKLLGIDADPEALLRAKNYLHSFASDVTFVRDNFSELQKIVDQEKFTPVHTVLIDLGWSSPQFEERGRGFSFLKDEKLDMRYGGSGSHARTAADIVNSESEERLGKIFWEYGEEKLSKEIAAAVVAARGSKEIQTTGELVEMILNTYRTKLKTDKEIPWVGGLHPATKVFQALRIAVNEELDVIRAVLPQAVDVLESGGRLAVISFHSLEDRIVKHYFKSIDGKSIKILTKKPVTAAEQEAEENPRARSAKLRVIEKL